MNWYLMAFKKYTEFNGRSRRKEYWMFFLINLIVIYASGGADYALGTNIEPMPYGYIYMAYGLISFLPNLAVTIRRLHDVEKSGWFIFINLIPIVGIIWFIVVLCKEGTQGANKYGIDPKNPIDELNDIGAVEA